MKNSVNILVDGRIAKLEIKTDFLRKDILSVVDTATSYTLKNAFFSDAYKKGFWDGKTHLFSSQREAFPAGLAQRTADYLRRWADSKGYDIDVHVKRKPLPPPLVESFELNDIELRDYQLEAAKVLVEMGCGILDAATGSGKTEVLASVIRYIGRKALFLVPGKDLLFQTADRLESRLGIEVGRIGDGIWNPKEITVAIVISLARIFTDKNHVNRKAMLDLLDEVEVLIMDECHRIAAKTFYRVVNFCKAPYRFAISGTPLDREDGAALSVMAQSGPVIYKISNAELIDQGVLVPAEIDFHRITSPKIEPAEGEILNYAKVYDRGITCNYIRNEIIMKKIKEFYDQGLTILVIVDKIKHGNILDNLLWGFQKDFIPHEFLNGEDTSDKRIDVVNQVRSGILRVVIATSIFDEGIDIPQIDVIIIAAGGKARRRTIQRLGRGLRQGNKSGKLKVIDFYDNIHPYLFKHSKKRMKDYRAEKCFEVNMCE